MTPTSTTTSLGCSASHRKIIKNCLHVIERGEKLLQNGILHIVFRSSEIALES